jgi:nucleotide-binding universal stress UspA family protein
MFQRILLAIDETSAGEVGVTFACGLGRRCGASVHVVHANVLLVGGRGTARESAADALAVVERGVAQLRNEGIPASGELLLANAFTLAHQIADAATRFGSDVIVLGSQRRGRLASPFGGGHRERIIRATSLTVVTAPAPLRVRSRGAAAAEVRRMAQVAHRTD